MRRICCSLIIAGAAVGLAVGTANAAKGNRDAAMERCIAEAQGSASDVVGSGNSTRRVAVYKSCMSQAGFRP